MASPEPVEPDVPTASPRRIVPLDADKLLTDIIVAKRRLERAARDLDKAMLINEEAVLKVDRLVELQSMMLAYSKA